MKNGGKICTPDELADREAIKGVIAQLARGTDRGDKELILESYWPGAIDHHGPFEGSPHEFVEWLGLGEGPRVAAGGGSYPRLHCIFNQIIELSGAHAWVETYLIMRGGVEDNGFGRYLDFLERRDTEWRIVDRRVIFDCFAVDGPYGALSSASRRDPDDPSYAYLDRHEVPTRQ